MDINSFKSRLDSGGCVDLTNGANIQATVFRSSFKSGYFLLFHNGAAKTYKRKDFKGFADKANRLIKEYNLNLREL